MTWREVILGFVIGLTMLALSVVSAGLVLGLFW